MTVEAAFLSFSSKSSLGTIGTEIFTWYFRVIGATLSAEYFPTGTTMMLPMSDAEPHLTLLTLPNFILVLPM